LLRPPARAAGAADPARGRRVRSAGRAAGAHRAPRPRHRRARDRVAPVDVRAQRVSVAVTSARTALVALAATLAIQIYTSVAAPAPAVLAPMLAADLGITPTWIGVFVGLLYAGAMFGSLASGEFVARYGAIRVSQACVLICGGGLAAMASTPAAAVV